MLLISNTVVLNPYNLILTTLTTVQQSNLNLQHPYLKFQVHLIDLFKPDIQILYDLQINSGIRQCVNNSWTRIFKNKFTIHGQYTAFNNQHMSPVCWHTHDFGHLYIATSSHFFPFDFLILIILYCLKTCCYILDLKFVRLVLEKKDSLLFTCFKETIFFSFTYKLFNKDFSLPQSTCQFRVSIKLK